VFYLAARGCPTLKIRVPDSEGASLLQPVIVAANLSEHGHTIGITLEHLPLQLPISLPRTLSAYMAEARRDTSLLFLDPLRDPLCYPLRHCAGDTSDTVFGEI